MKTKTKKKKLFLVGISIMLIVLALQGINNASEEFLSNAWGADCGPCNTGYQCGVGNSSHGICDRDEGCEGTCTSTCAKGDPDQFCMGTSGSCSYSMVNCTPILKYRCVIVDLYKCGCYNYGSDGYCSRQTC